MTACPLLRQGFGGAVVNWIKRAKRPHGGPGPSGNSGCWRPGADPAREPKGA
jgi:hypothetical protein